MPLLASTASTPALSAVASRCRCFAADAKRNLQAASTAREEGLQKEGRPAGTGNDGPGGPQPTLEQQAHKAMGAAQDQLASAYAMGKVQAQVALGATLRLWDTVRSSDASRKTAAALGDAADKGLARLYEAARLLNQVRTRQGRSILRRAESRAGCPQRPHHTIKPAHALAPTQIHCGPLTLHQRIKG